MSREFSPAYTIAPPASDTRTVPVARGSGCGVMAGSTEDRHNDLVRQIAELEARRINQLLILKIEARCDQDTAEAEAVLQAIETELAYDGT